MTDTVLCTKADCRNLKQGTQPHKANKNCTRRSCKQCCEVVGGCRVHQVAAASSPVATQQHENSTIPPLATINPTSTQLDHPLVTASNSSSVSTSRSSTTTQSLPATSQNYAQPLDPNYARNYVLRHQQTLVAEQHFQADQSLSIMICNMIDIVLWLKNNEPPHLIKLTCSTPGKFVPGDHPLLMRFKLGDYIAVYCSDQHAWIEQDIKTPLLSPPNSTILLRSIDLTDNHMLLGFAERVSSLSCMSATVQSPSKRSFSATGMHLSRLDEMTSPLKQQRNASSTALISRQSPIPLPLTSLLPSPTSTSPLSLAAANSDTSPGPVLVPALAMVHPNTIIPAGARARFPWKYACDMVPRIQLFVNLSDDQMIQALFTTTFPNCTYTKATFYKHCAAYQAAIENSSDRVERAVNAGYSPAGQWNTLLAEIKANAASSLTGSNSPGSVSNSDTKCPTLPLSLPTTDIGLPLPTDLTSEMSDALVSLFKNIDEMDNDTAAATTNSEFPLDLSSYPQFDLFSTWLNDPSPIDYQSLPPLPPLPPFN